MHMGPSITNTPESLRKGRLLHLYNSKRIRTHSHSPEPTQPIWIRTHPHHTPHPGPLEPPPPHPASNPSRMYRRAPSTPVFCICMPIYPYSPPPGSEPNLIHLHPIRYNLHPFSSLYTRLGISGPDPNPIPSPPMPSLVLSHPIPSRFIYNPAPAPCFSPLSSNKAEKC